MINQSNQLELQHEAETLRKEYQWLLKEEIPSQISQVYTLLVDCSRRFLVRIPGVENNVKPEKFLLNVTSNSSSQENVKCVVTLLGDNIYEAEIQVKVHKHHGQLYKINADNQWKLQQLQDAGNHLIDAIECLNSKKGQRFHSGQEVMMLLSSIMSSLTVGRHCLIMPRKKTIQELQNSRNMKTLSPPPPSDMAVSFYIQSHKLCFAVYHVHSSGHGVTKFDVHQGECLVPWLNEALAMFTVAMQMCQQMKDKVSVFSQYTDIIDESALMLSDEAMSERVKSMSGTQFDALLSDDQKQVESEGDGHTQHEPASTPTSSSSASHKKKVSFF